MHFNEGEGIYAGITSKKLPFSGYNIMDDDDMGRSVMTLSSRFAQYSHVSFE